MPPAERLIATGPPAARSARFVLGATMVGAAACVLPFAGVRMAAAPAVLPVLLTAIVLADAVTSFLLMQQYVVRGEGYLVRLAAMYLLSALLILVYGVLAASLPAAVWIWAAWRAAFPAGLALSVLPWPQLGWHPLDRDARRTAVIAISVSLPVAAAVATSLLIAHAGWPVQAPAGGGYSGLARMIRLPTLGLDAFALAALLARRRSGGALTRWLGLTALAALVDSTLWFAAGAPSTLGWYAAAVMSTLGAGIILGVLLHEVTVLYGRLWDAHERLAEESRHDFLTALLTRREGLRRAASLVQQAERHRFPISLALLDIDHFKAVNDVHGHAAGDRVLEEVAARVRASLRAGDFAFRLGGEEFGIMLSHAVEEDALEAGWRILRAIRSRPVKVDDAMLSVSASIGVAQLRAGESIERLIECADQALYEAKRSGRDRARGFTRLMLVREEAEA